MAFDAKNVVSGMHSPWRFNLIFAYIAWFIGGLFGAHHFYLKRDRHAFLCCCTAGGCFGIGAILDFFRIPSYVKLENDLRFSESDEFKFTDPEKRPKCDVFRFACQTAFGVFLGTIMLALFPLEIISEHRWKIMAIHSLVVAIGVHTVANIGKLRCPLKVCIAGSVVPLALVEFSVPSHLEVVMFYTGLSSSFAAYFKGWRCAEPSDVSSSNVFVRFLCVYGATSIVYIALFSAMYWNTHIVVGGVSTPLGEFFSEERVSWKEIKNLLTTLKESGWIELFLHLVEVISPGAFDDDALKILQLDSGATIADITNQYRKMARRWHPDKYRTGSAWDKKWAEKQFIMVRQAYETLLSHRKRHHRAKFKSEL